MVSGSSEIPPATTPASGSRGSGTTQQAAREPGVERAQAAADARAEELVLDAGELVGVAHQRVDHGAVEEQRAPAQAVLRIPDGERLEREEALLRQRELERERPGGPLGRAGQQAQLAAQQTERDLGLGVARATLSASVRRWRALAKPVP